MERNYEMKYPYDLEYDALYAKECSTVKEYMGVIDIKISKNDATLASGSFTEVMFLMH